MISFGNVPAGSVLPVIFDSFAGSTGASITLTGLAVTDIEVYKGTSMTQRSSDAGYTLLDTDGIDLDGVTGIHGFSIDTGDNTDAGFYAAGSFYTVVVSSVTIDSQTVNFVAATFRLVAAENTAGTPAVDAVRLGGTAQTGRDVGASVLLSSGTGTGQLDFTSGVVKANVTQFNGVAATSSSGRPEVNATHFAGTAYATALAAEVDAVWDEVLTGAAHNVPSSAGRRLRTLDITLDSGTAAAGTADSITLAASASATASLYVGCRIYIDGGTGAGQSRYIVGYTAARVAWVARSWTVTPDGTSTYVVAADNQTTFIHLGLAQAGAASTITLDAAASATDNIYNGQIIRITAGTGDNQIRIITAYNGTTKVATVAPAWTTQPNNTSYFATLQSGVADTVSVNRTAQTAGDIIGGTNDLQTSVADLPTNAELAAALGTADDATLAAIATTDGKIDAIKAKTDSLNFTVANQVDANIQYVNDVLVNGTGALGDEWGP